MSAKLHLKAVCESCPDHPSQLYAYVVNGVPEDRYADGLTTVYDRPIRPVRAPGVPIRRAIFSKDSEQEPKIWYVTNGKNTRASVAYINQEDAVDIVITWMDRGIDPDVTEYGFEKFIDA